VIPESYSVFSRDVEERELPVKAKAKRSGAGVAFNGIKYINDNGDVFEVVI
jgi:hypothetical protein